MIGVLLALAVQSSQWGGVSADGWTLVGESASRNMLYFTRAADRRSGRLWVRMEYAPDHPNAHGFRSTRALVAADCVEGRLKSLQTTSFREPNLLGASESLGSEENWFYPGPDTLHERVLNQICAEAAD